VRAHALTARTGRLYFAVQTAAGAAWWLGVWLIPAVRSATLGALDPLALAVLDIPLFVIASALVACELRWAVWIVVPWTSLVAVCMAGYATLTGTAGWGALLMVAAAAGSVMAGMLVLCGRLPSERMIVGPFAFCAAPETGSHVTRTVRQLSVFWGVFLVVLPALIVAVEHRWGLVAPVMPAIRIAGGVLLVAASALGIWSALTMATRGAGTPLPSAMPRRLVVAGPYRWVRNPMAVAGIAQGVAVGMLVGSWLVVLYALSGSLVWNTLIRPHEEADLESRFGQEYDDYRARVRCWMPGRPFAVPVSPGRR